MAEKKGHRMDTRGALVDAVLAMVGERSFESTSVDAIVAKAGLSKGTFFHYFPTKEAVLDAACERLAQQAWDAVKGTFEGPGEPIEKLAKYLVAGRAHRVAHARQVGEIWESLAKEHNAPVRAKVSKAYRERVRSALSQLVAYGAVTGHFDVEDSATTADLLLELVEASAEGSMRLLRSGDPEAAQKAARRVNATVTAVERILGAKPGALARVAAATLEPFQKQPTPGPAGGSDGPKGGAS